MQRNFNKQDFSKWFNRNFWRGFSRTVFAIDVPNLPEERNSVVESVYDDIKSARYSPNIPEAEIVINKGNGVARNVPVFSVRDYCVFYFCIKELEEILCGNRTKNTFGGWTLGGQLRAKENDEIENEATNYGRYSFNPQAWTHAFGEFNSLLFSQLDGYSYVLQLDLANFYDCIRLDILERWIREQSPAEKGWIITLLFYFLNNWNRRNTGLHPQAVGLPQDALADCSRILANFYLQKYDKFAENVCEQAGGSYFRYADDQMVLLNSLKKVDNILLLLTRSLDRYGLRINQKKVKQWKSDDLTEHRCRRIQSLFADKKDNKNPEIVVKFVQEYLRIPKRRLRTTWNCGFPLLNRLLWANLEALPQDLFEAIADRIASRDFLIQATTSKLLRIEKLNRLLAKPSNIDRKIKVIASQSVHNAFHYEAIEYARVLKKHDLEKFLVERLRQVAKLMSGNIVE